MNIVERYNMNGEHIRYNTEPKNNLWFMEYLEDASISSMSIPSPYDEPNGEVRQLALTFRVDTYNRGLAKEIVDSLSAYRGENVLEVPTGFLRRRTVVMRDLHFVSSETTFDQRLNQLVIRVRLNSYE